VLQKETIRQALEEAAQIWNASYENIIQQLTALGFNCDEEDAMGAFQELDDAALRHPPMNLDVAEAVVVGMYCAVPSELKSVPWVRGTVAVICNGKPMTKSCCCADALRNRPTHSGDPRVAKAHDAYVAFEEALGGWAGVVVLMTDVRVVCF
jgi:hypothetical protein